MLVDQTYNLLLEVKIRLKHKSELLGCLNWKAAIKIRKVPVEICKEEELETMEIAVLCYQCLKGKVILSRVHH
jgi:ssDNA-binding Zn-finger/Zn-ribbon topoisomerase 1